MGESRSYCFQDRLNNLYEPIREEALNYFAHYDIKWWVHEDEDGIPTCNSMSSQIACVNHLFPFYKDKESCLVMLRRIDEDFSEALPYNP
jgi:hypothetical protein